MLSAFFSRSVDGVGIGTLYDEMLRATPDLPLVAPCKGVSSTSRLGRWRVASRYLMNSYLMQGRLDV